MANDYAVLVAKTAVLLILICSFVFHVWEQVDKFLSKKTMTVETVRSLSAMPLPAITFCSDQPYKKPGFHYSQSAFNENAYTWEEMFHSDTIDFIEEKDFVVTEVLSQFRGRCFTLTSRHEFAGREYVTISIMAPEKGPKLYTYVHQPGQEFFVVAENFPFDVSTEATDSGSDCVVDKHVNSYMHLPGSNKVCSHWSQAEFLECADRKLRESIAHKNFTCSVIWWHKYFPEGTRPCSNQPEDLEQVWNIGAWVDDPSAFLLNFASRPDLHGCPRTCQQLEYQVKCREFSMDYEYLTLRHNSDSDSTSTEGAKSDVGTEVWFYYLRTEEELEEELLLYDISAIVAGVGGSLGLFLGFSCLQVCFGAIDYLSEKARKRWPRCRPHESDQGRLNKKNPNEEDEGGVTKKVKVRPS